MNKLMIAAIAAAGLSACSESASNDNQAAQTAATEEVVQDNMTSMAMNDPADPHSPAMMKMHQAMMSAAGANASETWARKMIPHHQGAIDMSNALLEQGGDEKFLAEARKTSADMQKEIASLQQKLQAGVTAGGSTGPANPFGPAMEKMHAAMMAATGATPGETWARKMIPHHQGAIDMSDIILKQGGDPKILESARMTRDMQVKEIADLQKMLGA
jgi:uncharacterized protein (DUF305 family)